MCLATRHGTPDRFGATHWSSRLLADATRYQLAARVLSEASRVPSHQIRHGDMTEEEMRRFIQAAAGDDAFREGRFDHLRKDGHDVDAHVAADGPA